MNNAYSPWTGFGDISVPPLETSYPSDTELLIQFRTQKLFELDGNITPVNLEEKYLMYSGFVRNTLERGETNTAADELDIAEALERIREFVRQQ